MSRSRQFPLRALWLIVAVVAIALSSPASAEADDTKRFLKGLKSFGISDDADKAKKPCICNGGPSSLDGRVGVLVAAEAVSALITYRADCLVPTYQLDRSFNAYVSCMGSGGTFTPLSK